MKTLFIQTHELAKKLDPNKYTCCQLNIMLGENENSRTAAPHIMKALYLEQKEDRKWAGIKNFGIFENIFNAYPNEEGDAYFTGVEEQGFRQRLINSLLTRPDRTLCVLIPE